MWLDRRWMMVTRFFRQVVIGAAALIVSLGWTVSASATETPVRVVATTGMIADAVERIGGDLFDVKTLMGPGVDPHAYRQTRSDIAALLKADLVLWHGLYLEAQMEGFFQKLGKQTTVVAVAEALPSDLLLAHDDYDSKFDPHIWMDPALWALAVEAVRDSLIDVQPDAGALITAQADAYLAEIRAIGDYASQALSSVSPDARVLLTAHDAFNYFGAAYEFDVIGIQGISTESEAGLTRIGDLVDLLVERDVRAVFVESSVSDRNIRALIEGAAAKGHDVKIGGELFSDAMGEPGTYEGTYLGMIDHNATLISDALGGEVDPRGFTGRLGGGS